ncbi:flagellar hook-length control protein FliK [Campylobacter sp. RM16704]|uniref:flagellar hook-length control protein FliK n=1 Tax=Campylobacter sp. RM16704 TaxID=1500960 RepID=UPI00057E401A|nr:flagellar hook-length control protein FliK [Campylobacter sp. RM16704]AJC86956.1 flagellar hook-length control protein [Campylobacter sp. RM16704]
MSNIQTSDALNLLSITPQNENLNKESTNSQDDGEEFLNSLLQAINEKDGSLPKDFKAPQKDDKVNDKNLKENINDKISLDEKDAMKPFEGANFMQILSLLEVLQSDSKDIKLNKLVKDNTTILALEKNLHKLKNIKNINELLNIAKDLGLNIKNIKFEQIKDLKESFPNLDKKGFFETPKKSNTNVFQDLVNQKISKFLQEDSSAKNIPVKNKESQNTSLLSSALKNLELPSKNIEKIDLKDKPVEKIQPQQFHNDKEIKSEIINNKNVSSLQNQQNTKVNKEKLNDNTEIINLTQHSNLKKEVKNIEKINLKDKPVEKIQPQQFHNDKEIKSEIINNKNVSSLQNQQNTKVNKEKLNDNTEIINLTQHSNLKKEVKNIEKINLKDKPVEKIQPQQFHNDKEIKSEIINNKNVSSLQNQQNTKVNKEKLNDNTEIINLTQHSNLKKEVKNIEKIDLKDKPVEKIQPQQFHNDKEIKSEIINNKNVSSLQNQQNTKVDFENLLNTQDKNIKIEKNTQNTNIYEDIFKTTKEILKDEKDNGENLNSYIREMNKVSNNFVKNQNIPLKETFNDFAQEFKEKIESYKAPITRFNITLNPHNLGEVEVTLIQRGSNLNISFNSNQNTLNLFIQHQAEFKNALVNMGFTNLEMNFNNQERKEQNNHQKQKNNTKENKVNFEKEIQEKPNLEMVLAKYF